MSGFGDFDFLIGDWIITNEFLRGRLAGSTTWETFPATSRVEKVMPIPEGSSGAGGHGGNLETMFVPARGFTGMTLRLFDPSSGLWSLYWSDTKSFRLFPPTVGKFRDGHGQFFGEDEEDGVPVCVRFDWRSEEQPVWEQSFSTDGGDSWEKNWIMRFARA